MFGIPNFDLLSDAGKQQFVEYVVNLARKEVLSYAPNFFATLGSGPGIASLPSNIVYQNTSYLDFNTDPAGAGPSGIGQLAWNDTNGTLEFILKGGNVPLDIGQENVALVKHADNTGLTKGKVVYVAGSDGTNKTVRYAQANSEATSSKTFGVMAEDATGGSKGFVCTQGIVSNINTLALTEGAAVYVSPTTAGDLTSTKPSAPNHMVLVGFCVRSHASNGVLYISVVNGFELQELHNVSINVGTLANGDIIKYNSSTQLWENVAADDIPAHASTHGSAGSDPITIAPSQVTGTAVINSDSRLTDTRTPTDASVTSPKFNIDYAAAPTVTEPGALYYNTGSSKLFVWDGSAWDEVGGGTGVPIGTIIWTGQGTIPSGFLDCDGSSQLRSAYPDLFAAIGTTYGQGSNPGTTFALPNVSSTTGNYAICAQVSPATITSESLIAVPIGTLQLYAGTVYPTGWLRADGSAISRTTYADLFSIIGTTYGSGDGSTTFNLPNLLSSGTGSPVYIIKVLLSGSIQPSTIAHAASHIRGGTDVIDADRAQIDYVPTNYTRNSGASEAGAVTDLTAHLSGINNTLGTTYLRSQMPTGSVINTAYGQKTDYSTYTSGTFTDINLSCTLNVSLANSLVIIQAVIPSFISVGSAVAWGGGLRLVTSTGTVITDTQGDAGGALGFWVNLSGLGGGGYRDAFTTIPIYGIHLPGTTGNVTYKIQVSARNSTYAVNYNASTYFPKATIIAQEIKQ